MRQGIVVSDKADKTITVRIDVAQPAPQVQEDRPHAARRCTPTTSSNEAHTGDTVRLVESRPLSRTKRWRLVEVLERAR